MDAEPLSHDNQPNNNIIPIDSRQRRQDRAEVIDFSEASVEKVTSILLSELRHPSRARLAGEELAAFIDEELRPKPDKETFSLESRLARLVDDDLIIEKYDEKMMRDEIFRTIVELQQQTRDQEKHFGAQRHAAMGLLKLRSRDARNETPDDEHWKKIIERLFT